MRQRWEVDWKLLWTLHMTLLGAVYGLWLHVGLRFSLLKLMSLGSWMWKGAALAGCTCVGAVFLSLPHLSFRAWCHPGLVLMPGLWLFTGVSEYSVWQWPEEGFRGAGSFPVGPGGLGEV